MLLKRFIEVFYNDAITSLYRQGFMQTLNTRVVRLVERLDVTALVTTSCRRTVHCLMTSRDVNCQIRRRISVSSLLRFNNANIPGDNNRRKLTITGGNCRLNWNNKQQSRSSDPSTILQAVINPRSSRPLLWREYVASCPTENSCEERMHSFLSIKILLRREYVVSCLIEHRCEGRM